MKGHGEAFVGIDAAKARNALAIAEDGRDGEIQYLGEFDDTPDAMAKLIRKLADRYGTLHICYEAGPTGYGLYRQVLCLGTNAWWRPPRQHECFLGIPQFLPGLRTSWQEGKVRPTAKPWRTARELLERLQGEQLGVYPDGRLRTLQRRLKGWRRQVAHTL